MTETSTFSILKHFPGEAARILKLSKKPTRSEFDEVVKITGLGIVLLGVVGMIFIILNALAQGRFS
jgi:protein transport protein SEC61 subunit gamma-like protein